MLLYYQKGNNIVYYIILYRYAEDFTPNEHLLPARIIRRCAENTPVSNTLNLNSIGIYIILHNVPTRIFR